MIYIRWFLFLVFWGLVVAVFHYTLPQKDVARIVDTFEQRVDFGENSIFWSAPDSGNAATTTNRDVLFIQSVRRDGRPMVYRNEDTGWSWPPYFKFDTKNLQTEAADLKSTKADPQWVLITHYGWRNEFLSIFPNAISVRPIAGPDVSKPIPWLNIIIITVFLMIVWAIWSRWRRFKANRIDPTLDDISDNLYMARENAREQGRGIRRWFRGKS
ncbi:DUF1523 family protein [Pseudaestuariivita atlantica]|uniref:DUF1523 domain-containing protein n=1 Tax=Pseudaestuariivita atlantica TaxID=1317121 RepID=A0A0L1JPZ2_9RHOB|nr:DUF1523 family protein [Pseudaestuariivita atlantica]KNG93840.1 hypothetical protein ATO11_11780 [Pseudaestuariivita atlantica]